MRTNKTRITITAIDYDHGHTPHDLWCDMFLRLRHARKTGDSEVVNNYVLSILRRYAGYGAIAFTEEKA